MKEIDIYDFDKTLVPYDSGSKFILYCVLHYPWCVVFMPFIGILGALSLSGIMSWTQFKKFCFSFMTVIPRKKAVKGFWDKHEEDVFPWLKDRPRTAVVISASPDFLLKELQNRIGFEKLICSEHNPKTGAIIGKNCARQEKVARFEKEFANEDVRVVDVYSDSLENDRPIFSLSTNKCYQVINGKKREFIYSKQFKEEDK